MEQWRKPEGVCSLRGRVRVRQHLHPSLTQLSGSGFSGVPHVCTLHSHVLIPAPAQLEHILTSSQDISPKGEIGTLEAMTLLPDLLGPWPA